MTRTSQSGRQLSTPVRRSSQHQPTRLVIQTTSAEPLSNGVTLSNGWTQDAVPSTTAFCESPRGLTPTEPARPLAVHSHRPRRSLANEPSLDSLHISLSPSDPRSTFATSQPLMHDIDRRSSSSLPVKKSDAPAHTFRGGSAGDDAPPSFAEATNDPPPPSPSSAPSAPVPSAQRVAPTLRGLLRFTHRRDFVILILPGLFFSAASGVIQPLMTIILGKAFQAFTDYSLSASHIPQPTPPGWLNARGHELTASIRYVCVMLAVLAFINVVVVTIATSIWVAHGALVTKRLQERVYMAVQGKNMAWFDTGMVGLEIEGEKDSNDTNEEAEAGDHAHASSSALMGHFLSLTDEVRIATSGMMGQVVQYTVTLLSALGIALHASWQLTLAILATLPLVVIASGLCERALVPRFLKDQDLNAQGMAKVEQVVGAISTVKAFNAEKAELSAFAHIMAKLEANYRSWTIVLGIRSGVVQFLCLSVFAQGFGLGSFLVTSGRASAGSVNTVFWACMIASSMTQTLLPAQTKVDKGKAAMARLVSLIDAAPPTPPPPAAPVNFADPPPRESFTTARTDVRASTKSPVSPRSPSFVPVRRHKSVRKPTHDHVRMRRVRPAVFSGELALTDVTFHYPSRPHPAPPALYDVSIYIPPRETTYIVGGSGSGKSTVAALLLGLYRPDQGAVEAEEQGLEWLDDAWLRSHVGCVSQGTAFLIEGTVHDNVALGGAGTLDWAGRPMDGAEASVTRQEVERACRAAMIHDFIIDLPNGYDTWLSGEKGASLSGGERQRIALARAFIRNPTVLVLDEATSALDATTRLLVHEAVKATRRSKTTVCITHDLSPIQPDDFVYVMQDGEVVQQGYRSELESTGGLFADMISLQAQQPIRQITFDDPSWEVPAQTPTPAATPAATTDQQRFSFAPPVGFSLGATNRVTAAWKASRKSRGDLTPASESIPPVPSTAAAARGERMSTIMASGRQATLRREGVRQARRAWTDEELGREAPARKGTLKVEADEAGHEAARPSAKAISTVQVLKTVLPTLPNKAVLFLGLFFSVVSGGATPIFSVLLGSLMGRLADPPAGFLVRTTMLIMLVALVEGLGFFFKHVLMELTAMRWTSSLRIDAFDRVIRQDQEWFDRDENARAKLASRLIKDAIDAREIIGQGVSQITVIISLVFISLVWSLVIGYELTLIGLAMGPLFVIFLFVVGRIMNRIEKANRALREDVAGKFFRTVANIKAIRSMSIDSALEARFREATASQYRAAIKVGPISGLALGFPFTLMFCAEALLFWVGARYVRQGSYTFERMTEVFSIIIFAISFAGQLISFLPSLSQAVAAASDMHRLVHLSLSTRESRGRMTFPVRGEVQLVRVDFHYPNRPDVQVLKDVSLTIRPGEFVGVVGASGSGKSTIANLVQRLYEPTAGQVYVDGRALSEVDVRYLRDHVGVVSQVPLLFDASVASNISYGCPDATQDEIESAARQAHAHDFIVDLPDGYETYIGEGGTLISGGQAQRIQIARALLRPSRQILILDECTSALDPANQAAIMDTILEVKEGRTTVIVTHKIAVMKKCDRLLVVDDGRLVEQGSFDELVGKPNGVFSTLARGGEWTA